MSNDGAIESRQFDDGELQRMADFIDRDVAWGDVLPLLVSFEETIARLIEATDGRARSWSDVAARFGLEDESDVCADCLTAFSVDELLDYVAKLVETLSFLGRLDGLSHKLGEVDEFGLGFVLRGLNDIAYGLK